MAEAILGAPPTHVSSPDTPQPRTLVQLKNESAEIERSWSKDLRYGGVFAAERANVASVVDAIGTGEISKDEGEGIIANRQTDLILAAQDDELTDLRSTIGFESVMALGINFDRRNHKPTSVMFIDLDGFKAANDAAGHDTGDQILIAAGGLINEVLERSSDAGARFHGDEFGIGLPSTEMSKAVKIALRVAQDMPSAAEEIAREFGKELKEPVTMSIGIVEMTHPVERDERSSREVLARLLSQADEAMYVAKKAGKDRIMLRIENPDGTIVFQDARTGEMHSPERDSKGMIIKDIPTNG